MKNLERNMLTKENIDYYLSTFSLQRKDITEKKNNQNERKKIIKKNKPVEYFLPNYKDKLFWCFYYVFYGQFEYEKMYNAFTEEKEKKIKLVQMLREKKDCLKKHKFKKSHVEPNLTNDQCINLDTFICLLTVFDISFVIHHNNVVYQNIIEDYEKTEIFIINDKKIGVYTGDNKKQMIHEMQNNKWIVENFRKPLRAISGYKIKELQEIATKLNINVEKKKKQELYMLIKQQL